MLICSTVQNYSSDTPPPLMMQDGQSTRTHTATPDQQTRHVDPLPPVSSAVRASDIVQAVQSETNDNSRLLRAVERQKPESFGKIKTVDGSNLLMLAAHAGCPRYTNFLLKYIDPNHTNLKGSTPLSMACLKGHHSIIPVLAAKTKPEHFPRALEMATHTEDVTALSLLLQHPHYKKEHILKAAQTIQTRHNGTHTMHPFYQALDSEFNRLHAKEIEENRRTRQHEARQEAIAKRDALKNFDHYLATLGLSSEKFNLTTLNQAHRLKALKYHPDKQDGDDRMFKAIQHAFERLKLLV